MVQCIIPFSFTKDLGAAYNTAMAKVTDEYAIIMDYDAMILTPNTLSLVDKYVKVYPEAALLTGYAARSHKSSSQHYPINNQGNILQAITIAERLERKPMKVKRIEKNLTGFFMVIKKATWDKYKFAEGIGCLGVDTDYWRKLIAGGETILLMETIFVWHTYRLKNGIADKRHLLNGA
jgi:GT2 family glycosyltransferase